MTLGLSTQLELDMEVKKASKDLPVAARMTSGMMMIVSMMNSVPAAIRGSKAAAATGI